MTVSEQDIPAAPARSFTDGYAATPPLTDEMVADDGAFRPHWKKFVGALDDLGQDELSRRWDQARRLIHENGITHNVYGDPNGLDRPWSLDFIPLLLAAAEWQEVGAALDQRARLLDLLLADLYGPARCVAEGLLPAELVYANPGFLRPCQGLVAQGGQHLQLYGADLVRGADRKFHVLSDRTQAPSGGGYSLENRIVMSRVLPHVFRDCHVQRLAPFFVALRQTLTGMAPPNRENPRVVLLTPGPYNETYFEHAYLARYLGYALVQGNDLTVRDANVYLKTLGGLQRVDVILRRVDDDFCDPLELFSGSYLGVPGLLEAVRQGNVAVANALGTGMLQGPAYLPFLPKLCRHFLSQDLEMSSVQTWWCGDESSRKYVLENLASLVIKTAFLRRGSDPVFGGDLSADGLEKLRAAILAKPTDFIAQEQVMNATAPSQASGAVEPRRFVVRAFLTATPDGYTIMPGALTRITEAPESRVVSLQKGGGSKDTWVLADGPVSEVTLLPSSTQPVELSRGGSDLPSRIADDLFWLGRYVQRAESILRTTRSAFTRLAEQAGPDSPRVVEVLAREVLGRAISRGSHLERELTIGVFGRNQSFGLRSTVEGILSLARVLRDRISLDAWRILQGIEREVSKFDPDFNDPVASVLEILNRLVVSIAGFSGLVSDSMTRGQAWRFLDIGHRIERGTTVARLLRSTLVDAGTEGTTNTALLDAVLEVTDSTLTYRRRYLTYLQVPPVVDLLLADESNPRAVAYQAMVLADHLNHLPCEAPHPHDALDRQTALKLRTMLQLADVEAVCKPVDGYRPALQALLNETIEGLAALSERIGQIYFSHAAAPRHLLGMGEDEEQTP